MYFIKKTIEVKYSQYSRVYWMPYKRLLLLVRERRDKKRCLEGEKQRKWRERGIENRG